MSNAEIINNSVATESVSFNRTTAKSRAAQTKELLKLVAELKTLEAVVGQAKEGATAPQPKGQPSGAPAGAGNELGPRMNPLLLLYEAVGRSQDSESQQEITDAQTTESAVSREEEIYYYWNEMPMGKNHEYHGKLGADAGAVEYYAGKGDGSWVSYYQTVFNEDSSTAQAFEGQADAAVQSGQNQTSGDASNSQKIVQMVGTIDTILSTVAQLLAQGLQG